MSRITIEIPDDWDINEICNKFIDFDGSIVRVLCFDHCDANGKNVVFRSPVFEHLLSQKLGLDRHIRRIDYNEFCQIVESNIGRERDNDRT